MVRYISSNLRLPVVPYGKDKGRHSIQITRLTDELASQNFRSIDEFADTFCVETSGRGKSKRLLNFKLFIIMDTDDCTDKQRDDYISGRMFAGHWLREYIVPIYNTPNLDIVLYKAGIIDSIPLDKGDFYENIFPINKDSDKSGTVDEIVDFQSHLLGRTDTNISVLTGYMLDLLPHD